MCALRSVPLPQGLQDLHSLYDATKRLIIKSNDTSPTSYRHDRQLCHARLAGAGLKTEYFARRISRHDLDEISDSAAKAAIQDQEIAGLDIITDGEPRRDNMVDYFVERFPGVQIDRSSKKFYYDFYDSEVQGKLPVASLGLSQDYKFLRMFTDRQPKFCITGPHCLIKRIRNKYYPSEEALAMDLAKVLNLELKALVKAGANFIQIDEPYYSGFPEDLPWAVRALNALVEGVDAKIAVHICYGNRYGKPSWEGSYRYLFPTILEAKVQQLTSWNSPAGAARIWSCSRNSPAPSSWVWA